MAAHIQIGNYNFMTTNADWNTLHARLTLLLKKERCRRALSYILLQQEYTLPDWSWASVQRSCRAVVRFKYKDEDYDVDGSSPEDAAHSAIVLLAIDHGPEHFLESMRRALH